MTRNTTASERDQRSLAVHVGNDLCMMQLFILIYEDLIQCFRLIDATFKKITLLLKTCTSGRDSFFWIFCVYSVKFFLESWFSFNFIWENCIFEFSFDLTHHLKSFKLIVTFKTILI